jgi:hypothetical protein
VSSKPETVGNLVIQEFLSVSRLHHGVNSLNSVRHKCYRSGKEVREQQAFGFPIHLEHR